MPPGSHCSATGLEAHPGRSPGNRRQALILIGIGSLSSLLYLSFALATKGISLVLPFFPLRKGIIPTFLLHFFLLFALYLAVIWYTSRHPADNRSTILTLIAFSVAFRVLLLWTQPVLSDDIYRYVWDGRVQAAGLNPYLYAPEAAELAHLRDNAIYPRINRAWGRTIYPPGAQWLFRAIHAVQPQSILSMKAAIMAFDLLTILLLLTLLRRLKLPADRAIVYAWHPLAVFEFAGSGHLDGLMLPFMVLCLLLWESRRDGGAGVSLGAAVGIKLYPALLVPALIRRRGPRLLFAAATVVGLLYLPYLWTAHQGVFGFLPQYLSDPGERFNSGPGGLLAYGVGLLFSQPVRVAYGVLALALLVVTLRGPRAENKGFEATVAEALLLIGTFVTFAQTVHPWYLIWIIPLLAIRPSGCWLYLSGAVALSYVKYTDEHLRMPLWAGILEYLPFYLLALLAFQIKRSREAHSGVSGRPAGGRVP